MSGYQKMHDRLGKAGAAKRRRCLECDRESTPGGLSSHQKASSHTGYETVSPTQEQDSK